MCEGKAAVNNELACLEVSSHRDASDWERVGSMRFDILIAFLASPLAFVYAYASLVPDIYILVVWI